MDIFSESLDLAGLRDSINGRLTTTVASFSDEM